MLGQWRINGFRTFFRGFFQKKTDIVNVCELIVNKHSGSDNKGLPVPKNSKVEPPYMWFADGLLILGIPLSKDK
jgi:hypothetical protein